MSLHRGCTVRVIACYDETFPEKNLGRLGRIVSDPSYQEVGDDPDTDPFWEVRHAPCNGMKAECVFYWTDELELVK